MVLNFWIRTLLTKLGSYDRKIHYVKKSIVLSHKWVCVKSIMLFLWYISVNQYVSLLTANWGSSRHTNWNTNKNCIRCRRFTETYISVSLCLKKIAVSNSISVWDADINVCFLAFDWLREAQIRFHRAGILKESLNCMESPSSFGSTAIDWREYVTYAQKSGWL